MNTVMQEPADNLKIRLTSVGNPVIHTPVPQNYKADISSADLKILYKVSVVVNRPLSLVDVEVTMSYQMGQKTIFSGSLTTTFDVLDLASYITAKDGEDTFRIESDFFPMLLGIAFSTTRGYFVRELQGTALGQYPFPMISIDSIKKRTSYRLV